MTADVDGSQSSSTRDSNPNPEETEETWVRSRCLAASCKGPGSLSTVRSGAGAARSPRAKQLCGAASDIGRCEGKCAPGHWRTGCSERAIAGMLPSEALCIIRSYRLYEQECACPTTQICVNCGMK